MPFSNNAVNSQHSRHARSIGRTVCTAAGLLFIAAVVMKMLSPAVYVGAVLFVVSPVVNPVPGLGRVLATGVLVLEAFMGVALLLGVRRSTCIAASIVFFLFAAVLAVRFTGHNAPPCACLGRMLAPGQDAVYIDIVRNLALAVALLLVLPPRTQRPDSSRSVAEPDRRAPNGISPLARADAGFTLVEALMTIGAIAALVAILLPALAGAKRAAKQTESIAVARQIAATLRVYGTDNREYFPAFANLGTGTTGPVLIRGQTFAVGYFRAHIVLWPPAVSAGDPAVMPGIQHPMLRDTPISPATPGNEETLFFLTAAVAAAPPLFQASTGYPYNQALIGPQRWSDVTFASGKGLILDGYWWGNKQHQTHLASFCDGSAGRLEVSSSPILAAVPGDGPRAPVISTIDGLHGRDR